MRNFPRLSLLGAALAALLLSAPGLARAENPHGAKVEDRLAKLADEKGGNEELSVLVVGSDAGKAGKKVGSLKKELSLVGAVSVSVKVKHLDKLAADPDVDFVAADVPVAPTGVVDYSKLSTSYIHADKAQKVWDKGYDGKGIGIAVIDSGIQPVADFGTRLVQVSPASQTWANDDVVGHGSLVAGVIAGKSSDGKFIGVAPGATVYALNVANPEGVHSSDVIEALQWVYENAHTYNIRVANLSLGETVPGSYLTSTLDLAVERLWAAGIVVVVSAGNGGGSLVDFAPANDPLAITVGATDNKGTRETGDDATAIFSPYGVTVDGATKPDLLAPGRLIASVLPAGTALDLQAPAANRVAPGYATISGTSFAAPQVAGAAAILLQRRPDWSPDNVKWALVQKARSVSSSPVRALDVEDSFGVGTPGRANQGVMALVCAPGSICLPDTGVSTLSSSWNSSSWNSSSWNSSSWNSSSWNSSSWNSSSWNSSSWNSSSWNSSSWNSSSWNSSSWNSSSWNSFSWD